MYTGEDNSETVRQKSHLKTRKENYSDSCTMGMKQVYLFENYLISNQESYFPFINK